jgi:hypothetical protein
VELTLFRVVQEALTNVLRHAGQGASGRLAIRYARTSVEVEMADDGGGTLAVLLASASDVDDLVPTLVAFQIEWNKIRQRQRAAGWPVEEMTPETCAAELGGQADDWARLKEAWGDRFADRMALVAALEAVSGVTWFEEDTPEALIRACRPDVLVKGGDWPVERIVGAAEVLARGGRVLSIPFEHERSTTALVQRIRGTIAP